VTDERLVSANIRKLLNLPFVGSRTALSHPPAKVALGNFPELITVFVKERFVLGDNSIRDAPQSQVVGWVFCPVVEEVVEVLLDMVFESSTPIRTLRRLPSGSRVSALGN
jgi:hypothetical protein